MSEIYFKAPAQVFLPNHPTNDVVWFRGVITQNRMTIGISPHGPPDEWVPHDDAPDSVRRIEKALGGQFVTRRYHG